MMRIQRYIRHYSLFGLLFLFTAGAFSQQTSKPFLSSLSAGKGFPLYTTYAAVQERSAFALDEGYEFRYDTDSMGADFITDTGGDLGICFRKDGKWIYETSGMYEPPVITISFPDRVSYYFEPYQNIRVSVLFAVWSSRLAFLDMSISNTGSGSVSLEAYPFIRSCRSGFSAMEILEDPRIFSFRHVEKPDSWTLAHQLPVVDSIRNILMLSEKPDEVITFFGNPGQKTDMHSTSKCYAYKKTMELGSGETRRLRMVRGVSPVHEDVESLVNASTSMLKIPVDFNPDEQKKFVACGDSLSFQSKEVEALYWSCTNMMRQQFLPPEAKSAYNYYVFSREPQWGWGHGGQVFHESLSMLAYADIDPAGAMNSQRVFAQRQYPNGYINYRTGSYLDEIIEYEGELTSSAPWYAYINWEVYKKTGDKNFLREMYGSSKRFYEFYVAHRDKDQDGLCEWGGHAVLESVRDGLVAVWDQVGWPSNFESADLNCMLVMEARSLAGMARELGLKEESAAWTKDAETRKDLINRFCWDEVTGFYYNVNKTDHSFTYKKKDDLKRMEIIGFLPLWAGVASREQAARLMQSLTDTSRFWRPYGVPTLSADDSYYNGKGYWNGPVWVQWEFLIMRGLLDYGYRKEAKELVGKVTAVMIDRLGKDHNLWEFYSPDTLWGGHHKTYIWAGIVNKMMMDTGLLRSKITVFAILFFFAALILTNSYLVRI